MSWWLQGGKTHCILRVPSCRASYALWVLPLWLSQRTRKLQRRERDVVDSVLIIIIFDKNLQMFRLEYDVWWFTLYIRECVRIIVPPFLSLSRAAFLLYIT